MFRRSLPSTSKSKVRRHQTLALASPLHCCAYATGCTGNRGVLAEQALLLSKESLIRQRASMSSCGIALAAYLLLAKGSGYYRCKLSCLATKVDHKRPLFLMPFACRTAALLGLCFQPVCTVTALVPSPTSHLRYSRFHGGEPEQRKVCRLT